MPRTVRAPRTRVSSRGSAARAPRTGAVARRQAAARDELLDLVVVGGCGHVGLPLALSFAEAGLSVGIFDTDRGKAEMVARGRMPFRERGAEELLTRMLESGRLQVTDAESLTRTTVVVLVIGTPVDEFLNPSTRVFERAVDELAPAIRDGTLVVLRSTVYPGTTDFVEARLAARGKHAPVVFCPERVAEGHALEEIRSLPQIIGAATDEGFERACALFATLGVEVIRTTPREAELAKLMTNTWRYVKFAVANQFYEIANSAGVDYANVLHAVKHNYPRAADLPGPGFAAGPCLLKDTMQLAAFATDHFPIGHSAMLINEGLPGYIVDRLEVRRPLAGRKVGILGMAFKGDSDDPRTSLSYKLRKLAAFKGAEVLCTDPYIEDPTFVPLERVLGEADVLIVAAPHSVYRAIEPDGHELVDIWNLFGRGLTV
jgi:UDP-N-acetyl-D-mannosaminuronic acid dehydrogenase